MTIKQQVSRTLSFVAAVVVAAALLALGYYGESDVATYAGVIVFMATVATYGITEAPVADTWPDSVPASEFDRKRTQLRASLRKARANSKEAA